jgi:chemotaxis protein MotB
MKLKEILFGAFLVLTLVSCVSNGKYKALQQSSQARYDSVNGVLGKTSGDLRACNDNSAELTRQNAYQKNQIDNLNTQIAYLKENNTQALKQLQDLSVISGEQAASIKKSMDNIGAKDAYIQDLQQSLARKDSLNMALVMNLKGAIGNLNDQDINIKVDKGVVFIDISDKLLFNSGSYTISSKAKEVLGKVALVLKNQSKIEFMVEGHTDNKPYRNGVLLDNWDLSVKRATAVVRILQNQYGLDPAHITAAGRSEYIDVASNDTAEGRAQNRRTRIVILPQLDQFFQLLERK